MRNGSFTNNLGRGEKFVFFALMGTAAIVVFGALFGLLVQFLWNSTLVGLLGVAEITFWQSIGVLVLAKLFFGFGSSGGPSRRSRKKIKAATEFSENNIEPVADLVKRDEFRKYWAQEGREAYEAFRANENTDDDTQK